MTHHADILIVDDIPANLQVLSSLLKEQGYKARAVTNGKLALQAISRQQPDLILLDINMPEMNGYEVCQQLKSQPDTQEIPIIFISALNELEDKVKAFQAGGVDYITKPFQFEEVKARVETHLRIRQLQHSLQTQNASLEASLERERELESLRDNLVNMMVHDLRSPLTGILGYLSLLEIQSLKWDEKSQNYLSLAQQNTEVLVEMISQLLDLHRIESGEMPLRREETCLKTLVQEATNRLGAHVLRFDFEIDAPATPVLYEVDASLLQRVLSNLLGNAFKFTPAGGKIKVCVHDKGRIEIIDSGPGVPEADQQRIFDKFGQVEARAENSKYSTGLGLAFCRMVLEAHGGQIGVDSEVGKGSTFWIELCPQQSASPALAD